MNAVDEADPTAHLDYELRPDRIARRPAEPRDQARLLVDGGPSGQILDRQVHDLPDLVGPGDLVVLNTTRSRHSHVTARTEQGRAVDMILVDKGPRPSDWVIRVPPSVPMAAGLELAIDGPGSVVARVARREQADCWIVELCGIEPDEVERWLDSVGHVPVPPYADLDIASERLQTVFADEAGSAAPPTAGLHLTSDVLARCVAGGARLATVDLQVSLRTPRYRHIDLDGSLLHSERYDVPEETIAACRSADRVIAIGTTVIRALESVGQSGELNGRTAIFITRPFDFQFVDTLFTNFQAPRSTILAMVDAFVGPRWRTLYEHALNRNYRFLALGDACLLRRG